MMTHLPAADLPPADVAGQVRPTEQEALLNVHTVLRLCGAGGLRCSDKTRRPTAATVGAVQSHLAMGDFYATDAVAAFAWPLLLQAGGHATLDGGRLQLTARGRAALRKPPADTIRELWRRWLTHAVIDELSRVEAIKGQRAANVLTAASKRRRTVAEALASCPPGEWLDVDALFAAMRRAGLSPTVARNERALWKLYLVDAHYGSLGYAGFHDWEILEGRYTLAVLFEYAGTLGLVDLDYVDPRGARVDFRDNWGAEELDALSRYDGLRAIRLTALGRYALGLQDRYQPAARAQPTHVLTVLPNLDVVVTGTLEPGEELLLSAYATRTGDRVWSLSAASLLAAVDAGHRPADLIAFLTQRAAKELPAVVPTLVEDVARRVSQLADLGPARVIACADPTLTALITRDSTLGELCRPLGEHHVAVPLDQEQKFRKALVRLGYALPSPG